MAMKLKQKEQDMLLTQSTMTYQSKIELKVKSTNDLENKSKSLIKKQEELVRKLKEKQI